MKKTVKKYKDGGKPKEVRTGRTYFKENSKEPLEKKDIKKTYVAKKNGKVVSREVTRYPRKGDMYTNLNTTSMDTTGYAAGDKKTFTVKQTKRSLYGKPSGNSWEIARGRVEGTIKDMKNGTNPTKMKKGGKLHLGFKEAQAKIAKKQGVSMKAAGAILASSARKASPAAVKKNPALLNVKRGKVKKYGDGGKTIKKVPANKYAKEQIFNLKKGSEEAKAAYVATNSGTVYQIKYPKSGNRASILTMDTTGYSKGKPSYKLDFENGSGSVKSKTVKRKDVKPLLKNMKKEVTSMRKGGKKK